VRYSDPVGRLIPAAPKSSERRRRWQDAAFAALDFEATGLDFTRDRIISFGVLLIDGGRVETDGAVHDLVDPGPVMVSAASVAVHGLRPEDLRGASSAEAAREALRVALSRRYLITWHGHVEASFLGVLYGTTPRRWLRRSVDVRWLVLALLGAEGVRLTLSEAADRFEVPVAAPHHALDDALVTANLFLVTAAQLGSEGLRTARDALRMGRAREPSSRRPVVPR
jgi:DNA polymerase III subunit epsilon